MPSTLTYRALQHHASCFSIRSSMQSTGLREDETYYDDNLTPRALNIRRSHLRENVPSPTGRYTTQSEATDDSQDSTPRGLLRVMNPDIMVDNDYHEHRRAAVYVRSPAQQALQLVVAPHRSVSTHSSRSRLSSLGSEILNTVKRRKPKRDHSAVSAKHNPAHNPLRAPPDDMSDTESQSAGVLSRSASIFSKKSSNAGPQAAPMSVVAPFAHTEVTQISPIEYLTPGGIAAAKLDVQSFTAIYRPDAHHYSPAVTVWVVVNIKCVKFLDRILDSSDGGTQSTGHRSQHTLRSHGQIANLAVHITPPEGFDIICVLGRLQHRQILMGSNWSVVFKLQPQKKVSTVDRIQRSLERNGHPDGKCYPGSDLYKACPKSENDKLMEEVEKMLMPEEKLVAEVQYNHNLFPTTTTVQESDTCPIRAITESERRQRQYYEQRGQTWRQQRGTSALTTSADLDRDLQMAKAICAILQEGIGAKWPKNAKSSIKYTTILPKDALQLLYDFREAAGATLPQDIAQEMDRLRDAYDQVRKERQEGSLTRKSLKAVFEMGRLARRAIPTSSTFSGRYSYNTPSISDSMRPLNPGRNTPENQYASLATAHKPWVNIATLKDITNDTSRLRGVAKFIDGLPIVGRRKNARTDTTEREADVERGTREEDDEIKAIWKKVRVISGASSTISDDMERINESNLGSPPWM